MCIVQQQLKDVILYLKDGDGEDSNSAKQNESE